MNNSTAIFLVNDSVRAIYCIYDKESEKTQVARTLFKTFDQTLKPNDLVIVPSATRHGMTIVKVVEVDAKINYDDTTEVKWIVGKVDRHPYEVILSQEGDMLKVVREAEEDHKREELRSKLLAHSEKQIQAMAITSMKDVTSLPPPVVAVP